jgi:hypothetical protein
MRLSQWLALLMSVLALVAFAVAAGLLAPGLQSLVGFYMAAVGGITAALGELWGTVFGEQEKRQGGAMFRAVGFGGLTLGSLLTALPDANAAVTAKEDLENPYIIACGALFILTALAVIIVLLAPQGKTQTTGGEQPGEKDESRRDERGEAQAKRPV